jgi:hypothetical protein
MLLHMKNHFQVVELTLQMDQVSCLCRINNNKFNPLSTKYYEINNERALYITYSPIKIFQGTSMEGKLKKSNHEYN